MKTAFIMSDVHIDFLNKSDVVDPSFEVMQPLFEQWFERLKLPKTDYLISAGDFSNDFLQFKNWCKFISGKYEKVFMVAGNHDLVVRGSTPSHSNLIFKTSAERLAAMKQECAQYSNLVFLDGDVCNGIGGTMGMCDFEYRPFLSVDYLQFWNFHWFDGRHWRIGNKSPLDIWREEEAKLHKIIEQQPKVVMTHFSPVEAQVPFEYRNDMSTCFFVFNGEEFLEKMPNDSYWICGHTHDSSIVDYKCKNGNIVHIIRAPHGYPGEEFAFVKDFSKFIINLPE